jgi:hypothetical protein
VVGIGNGVVLRSHQQKFGHIALLSNDKIPLEPAVTLVYVVPKKQNGKGSGNNADQRSSMPIMIGVPALKGAMGL